MTIQAPSNPKFSIAALDVVKGALRDCDGRVWLVIDAAGESTDCIDCDTCGVETDKGVICIDNRDHMCTSCFNQTFRMNIYE